MGVYSLASRAIGALTAGLVLYDSHKNGTISATMKTKQAIASNLVDEYVQSNQIGTVSTVEMTAKKAWFRHALDNKIKEPFNAVKGYVSGFCKSFVNDVIPASLATGALLLSKKDGIAGKMCGLGLLIYGAKYLLYDVMSVGKRDYLKLDV